MKTRLAVIASIAILAWSAASYAHHPFAAEYDWTKPVTLKGIVTKVEWTNPHSFIYLDAKDENGQVKHWTLEMGSPGALQRAGWTRMTLKQGNEVTVDAWRARTKENAANVKSVKLPDGRELSGASAIADIKPEKTISN